MNLRRINLNFLYTFFIVAKEKNLSKASNRLFVTEPAISMQIKVLECQLGGKLFERGKGFHLTELGEIVYEYCEKIFATLSELAKTVNDFNKASLGLVKIGAVNPLWDHLMPLVLSAFMEKYPNIKFQCDEGSSLELIEKLLNKNYDFVIAGNIPFPDDEIKSVFFTTSQLLLVAPYNGSFISGKKEIFPEQLAEIPLILKDEKSATRHIVLRELDKLKVKPNIIVESDNMEFIKDLVKRGKGFTFLPEICVMKELKQKELKVIKIKGVNLKYEIYMFVLKNKSLSPCAQIFWEYLLSIKQNKIWKIIKNLKSGLKI